MAKGGLYNITFDDGGIHIFDIAVNVMEMSGDLFHVVLNREAALPPEKRTYFGEYCPTWVRLRAEMRKRLMQGVLSELIMLEQEYLCDKVEQELLMGWNDGDIKKIDLCRKTLDGIISKTKVSMAKSDSDYKKAIMAVPVEKPKLGNFTTDELKRLLDATKEQDGEDK